jgi:hypothetical protein
MHRDVEIRRVIGLGEREARDLESALGVSEKSSGRKFGRHGYPCEYTRRRFRTTSSGRPAMTETDTASMSESARTVPDSIRRARRKRFALTLLGPGPHPKGFELSL